MHVSLVSCLAILVTLIFNLIFIIIFFFCNIMLWYLSGGGGRVRIWTKFSVCLCGVGGWVCLSVVCVSNMWVMYMDLNILKFQWDGTGSSVLWVFFFYDLTIFHVQYFFLFYSM